jgi:hypothetical protein
MPIIAVPDFSNMYHLSASLDLPQLAEMNTPLPVDATENHLLYDGYIPRM